MSLRTKVILAWVITTVALFVVLYVALSRILLSQFLQLETLNTLNHVQRARQAGSDGSVWLFSSSEAVANLCQMAGLQDMDWRGARAVATHPRIADAVRAAGWGVVVASRPALNDIRQTLGSIESQHP